MSTKGLRARNRKTSDACHDLLRLGLNSLLLRHDCVLAIWVWPERRELEVVPLLKIVGVRHLPGLADYSNRGVAEVLVAHTGRLTVPLNVVLDCLLHDLNIFQFAGALVVLAIVDGL